MSVLKARIGVLTALESLIMVHKAGNVVAAT
jgi:hypothetical protein